MSIIWPEILSEAKRVQTELKKKVKIRKLLSPPKIIAGADAIFYKDYTISAVVVMEYPSLKVIEEASHTVKTTFPYIPGYLSFREGPAIVTAFEKLRHKPDVILFDGQGIAHPQGLGIASHLGIVLNIPSIGCAKSKLVGDFQMPSPKKGAWSTLKYKGRTIGAVLRTRTGVKPVFVSPGHLITLDEAVEIVLRCSHYRIPEPIRVADKLTRKLKALITTS
ncbi:MAG: deoxyribonuclease V [Nitrospirae bacterium]|nr:deoxyribonuclease V [Nitrospirota bacterium]